MTDKLKCPFCGTVLGQVPNSLMFCCRNKACGFSRECMELQVWQALANGKKAQDVLNKIWHSPNEKPAPFCTIITEDGEWYWDTNGYYQGDCRWKNNTPWAYLQDVVDLIEITSITKQGK